LYHTNPKVQATISGSGIADLDPGFILGAETDTDDITGTGYLANEYTGEFNRCFFSIRIGRNEKNELCAKIKKTCKSEQASIELDDWPTLRAK
jgi:hypothetical protein